MLVFTTIVRNHTTSDVAELVLLTKGGGTHRLACIDFTLRATFSFQFALKPHDSRFGCVGGTRSDQELEYILVVLALLVPKHPPTCWSANYTWLRNCSHAHNFMAIFRNSSKLVIRDGLFPKQILSTKTFQPDPLSENKCPAQYLYTVSSFTLGSGWSISLSQQSLY